MDIKDFGRFLNDQQMNKKGMSADHELYSNEVLNSHQKNFGVQVMFGHGDTWRGPAVGRIGTCSGSGFQ